MYIEHGETAQSQGVDADLALARSPHPVRASELARTLTFGAEDATHGPIVTKAYRPDLEGVDHARDILVRKRDTRVCAQRGGYGAPWD